MKKLSTNELRMSYLKFFEEKDHMIIPSRSLVPHNDKSLLWINSGVAAIKKYLDGSEKSPAKRLVNSQKSIRTNDIENVGITSRHHTLFEMMGNFSIGDYFKEEGVKYQWEYLTKVIGLDKEKMYVTVYKNDDECKKIWADIFTSEGLDPQDRIIENGEDLNFWEVGEGPCGPNTEIFFDRGEKYDPEKIGIKLLVDDIDNDRYLEVVNVVFSQYNSDGSGNIKDYPELPMQNIDTGLGLERLAAIVQDVPTNYDTDNFQIIISEIEKFTDKKYVIDNYFKKDLEQENINIAFKVIADHVRANVFAIGDGVVPSNKDRGYVLRRILRRAIKWSRKLGITEPFMAKLVQSVVDAMADFYPVIKERQKYIEMVIEKEEKQFLSTIENGEKLLLDELTKVNLLPGDVAFKLYDTFGFPIELTIEIAADNNKTVDIDGYNDAMENHKELARNSHQNIDGMSMQDEELMNINAATTFVGYDKTNVSTNITWVKDMTNSSYIIVAENPFYHESGGQVSDNGTCNGHKVLGVIKGPNNEHILHVHGHHSVGDVVELVVENRNKITANHSAIHIINKILTEKIDKNIIQAGSFVDENKFRFDFSTLKKVSSKDMEFVEGEANKIILHNLPVTVTEMPLQDAKKIGAVGIFEDKYGESVRVVNIGDYSIELCGGTHVSNTSDIKKIAITSTESKGSGIYRIEGVTGDGVDKYFEGAIKNLGIEMNFTSTREGYNDALQYSEKIKQENFEQQKAIETETAKRFIENNKNREDEAVIINGYNTLFIECVGIKTSTIKELADIYRNKVPIIIIIIDRSEKTTFVVGVHKDYNATGVKAGDIVKALADGKGGGRPELAQGGISAEISFEVIESIVKGVI